MGWVLPHLNIQVNLLQSCLQANPIESFFSPFPRITLPHVFLTQKPSQKTLTWEIRVFSAKMREYWGTQDKLSMSVFPLPVCHHWYASSALVRDFSFHKCITQPSSHFPILIPFSYPFLSFPYYLCFYPALYFIAWFHFCSLYEKVSLSEIDCCCHSRIQTNVCHTGNYICACPYTT